MSDLNLDTFIRQPFKVRATKITEENIHEVAKKVGEVRERNGELYISLDRRIVPNVSRAYIGWYLTVLGDNLRCYAPKIFTDQFMAMPDATLVTFQFPEGDDEGPATIVPNP